MVGNIVFKAVLLLRLKTGGDTEATPRLCRNAVASRSCIGCTSDLRTAFF
jgi:hypothetical protein